MAAHTQKNNKPGKPPGKASGKEAQPLIIAKSPAEEQRLKLERLMRNPDKLAPIPDRPRDWKPRAPPEFVRDVMGSSAGAGSGEFHVYRHLRRREYQRQDFLDKMSEHLNKDDDYLEKLEQNKQAADDRTAKRRKKREKLKQKKMKAKKAKLESKNKNGDGDEKSSDSSEEEEKKKEEEEEPEAEDDAEAPSFIMGKK
ncbi:PRKR-interacting protein 1 homolog [Solea solea]|uniref:PRKR-interacting protein 1 homolog n=1 Tax=Solea solea TaxID=90069 RepID=UPI00272C4CE7|nr:PRKR-interacting protein 1 homolog [Solea solea]